MQKFNIYEIINYHAEFSGKWNRIAQIRILRMPAHDALAPHRAICTYESKLVLRYYAHSEAQLTSSTEFLSCVASDSKHFLSIIHES